MARKMDPENLSKDDVLYITSRPWLVQEMEMQGYDLPSLDSFEEPDEAEEQDDDSEEENEDTDYGSWTNARLREEIARRNEERDEDDEIVPEGSTKPDLVKALETDDEADEDSDEE